jgi:RNA polymerase sigma-70 factor (ECF subfamily)
MAGDCGVWWGGESVKQGSAQVAELYGTLGPAVYRRCLKLLRDRDEARDATQDVFMKLVRDMDRLQDRETVMPWIYRVATNHCLNLIRSRRRAGESVPVEDAGLELAPAASGAASYPDRVLARAVLAEFDTDTQAVAVGVLVDGMEHEELARALGVSRKTVQRRLERFLTRARELVLADGSTP